MSVVSSVALYVVTSIISATLAFVAWRRRSDQSRPFGLLMAAVAFWSFCHALSVADPTFEGTYFWAVVQYVGIVLVSPLWALFAMAYARSPLYSSHQLRIALFSIAALTLAAVWTNPLHHFWWTTVEPDTSRSFMSLAVTRGPLFWLHTIFSYGCVLYGLVLFFYTMLDAQLVYRSQARLVLVGALVPLLGNIALLLGLQLTIVDDPTPVLFSASGLLMGLATQRYQLLDLAPVAQNEIFESMPDGVVVIQRRGAIAAMNSAATRMLGVAAIDWVGRPIAELVVISPLAAALQPLLDTSGSTGSLKANYRTPSGTYSVEARLRPLTVGDNRRSGGLLLLRDVTESTRMEAQLTRRVTELTLLNQIARNANASAQIDTLLHTISGVITRTMAWDHVLIGILHPDGTAFNVLVDGRASGEPEIEGARVSDKEFPLIFQIISEGEPRVVEIDDPAIEDTPFLATMQHYNLQTALVVPLRRRTEALGVVIVGHTTAQQIVKEDLRLYETIGKLISDAITRARLYEAANEASALKSAFLATISHELRTPLTSIIGYADMLDAGVFGNLPESTVEPLEHVRRSGHVLLRMINDALDFSKMEAGHFSVDIYPVDLTTIIRGVVGAMQPQVRDRGLEIAIEIEPDLPLIQANSGRVEQVLTNLVANAIKFTERGTITIRAGHTADRVYLNVQDTGIGISVEDLSRLFHPFSQLDNQLTRRYGGAGLGLAISHRLMELMSGSLSVASTPGIGSTFMCELPALKMLQFSEAVASS